jgi:hypothetical protein
MRIPQLVLLCLLLLLLLLLLLFSVIALIFYVDICCFSSVSWRFPVRIK